MNTNTQIKYYSKRRDLFLSPQMFLVLFVSFGMIIATYFVLNNLFSSILIFVSTIFVLFNYTNGPTQKSLQLNESGFNFENSQSQVESSIKSTQIVSHTVLDYPDNTSEVLLKTTIWDKTNLSFYFVTNSEDMLSFMEYIASQKIKTDNNLVGLDKIHIFLGWLGLK